MSRGQVWFASIVGLATAAPFMFVGYFLFMFYGMAHVAPIFSGVADKPDGVPENARLEFNPKDDFYWTWCTQVETGAMEFLLYSPDRGNWLAWPGAACTDANKLLPSDRPYFAGDWTRAGMSDEMAVRLPENSIELRTRCTEVVTVELQQTAADLLRQVAEKTGAANSLDNHLVEVSERLARTSIIFDEEFARPGSPCARIQISD